MIIQIPGRETLDIGNIVSDFNGTLAEDGKIMEHISQDILRLKELFNFYIITADNYGTVREECRELGLQVITINRGNEAAEKAAFVRSLGPGRTLSIGNGLNDTEMLQESALSIAVVGPEGCAGKLLSCADILVRDIRDAFGLILDSKRIVATLRK